MKGVAAALLIADLGLVACADQSTLAPDPWKREWSYERIEDGIRGTTIVTAKIGSNEALPNSAETLFASLFIRTGGEDGGRIWLTDRTGIVCPNGRLLVKIGDDPVDEVACQMDTKAFLDPAMIPRMQRAQRVVVELATMNDGTPQQVTFNTSDLKL